MMRQSTAYLSRGHPRALVAPSLGLFSVERVAGCGESGFFCGVEGTVLMGKCGEFDAGERGVKRTGWVCPLPAVAAASWG